MKKAVAAYTPNVPWARFGGGERVDMNGAGTSAATPQVAAACALWLQKFGKRFRGWQRVEACRHALFSSAFIESPSLSEYFGHGALRARNMLEDKYADEAQRMLDSGELLQQPNDEVSFPFWRTLFGLGEPKTAQHRMFEVEAMQIIGRTSDPSLVQAVEVDP